jgi:type IX secretion system PorP/SprF family membrane protein
MRFNIISLLLLCYTLTLQAQWDASFSHYWAVRSYYNPAFAGATDYIRTAAAYRQEWAGIENAPQKLVLTTDLPIVLLRKRQGVGIVVYNELTENLRNALFAGQYSYRKDILHGTFQIGVQAGIHSLQYDADKRSVISGEEYGKPSLRVNEMAKQLPDLNTGIAWCSKKLFIGLSIMHITQPKFYTTNDSVTTDLQSDSLCTSISRSLNFMAGYNIAQFSPLSIHPMVWIQSDFSETVLQATLRLEYNDRFSCGFSWLPEKGYLLFGSITVQGIEMGYAFNKHTLNLGSIRKDSHELYLRYDLPLEYFKPKLQPQKSIRLL